MLLVDGEGIMKKAIALGILGLALLSSRAAAQTAAEQAQIVRDFNQSVADYTQRHQCLSVVPEAVTAATPAPKVFTLPVAMVFRQRIARALVEKAALLESLPPLPEPLEYRLLNDDLAIRDTQRGFVIAVLRDALGVMATTR